IIASRNDVVSKDNLSIGARHVLEGLAYSVQREVATNIFRDPTTQKHCYKYFYDEMSDNTLKQIDSCYIWHYSLANNINNVDLQSSMRIVYCCMFASLFGSIAKDANIKLLRLDHSDEISSGRNVSEQLPSYRLSKLIDYFTKINTVEQDWQSIYQLVNSACKDLFGSTLEKSLDDDIKSDIRYYKIMSNSLDSKATSELEVTRDLLDVYNNMLSQRSKFAKSFKENPVSFINPPLFASFFNDKENLPNVIFNFPSGIHETVETNGLWSKIFSVKSKLHGIDEDGNSGLFNKTVLYSLRKLYKQEEKDITDKYNLFYGALAPATKILKYGRATTSMCEVDLFHSIFSKYNNILWDERFSYSDKIVSSRSYYDFYQLDECNCDLCDKNTNYRHSQYVPASVIKQNDEFYKIIFPDPKVPIEAVFKMQKDWSGWILCDACIKKYSSELGIPTRTKL
ncbi:MAG: hypothetical protein V7735_23480, partial [Photobacterium frigidiphilum]|uniref:hypothetical protein n=1 Tax=Photobacterium frigidiphilum TaxID=264736 RepID=UPI003002D8DC